MNFRFFCLALLLVAGVGAGRSLAQDAPSSSPDPASSVASLLSAPEAPIPEAPTSPSLIPDASPSDGSVFRIALISDVHTDLSGKGNSVHFLPHFLTTIQQVNDASVDLVLIAGDLANHAKKEEWDDFKQRIRDFKAPSLYVPGNHDIENKITINTENGKKLLVTSELYQRYVAEMGPGFFVKEIAGLRVIAIAGSLFASGLPEEEQQWNMLQEALRKPATVPTVVVCHYPLYGVALTERGGLYWNIDPEPRRRLLALFQAGGVSAFLTGHLHHPLLVDAEGLPCIGAPSVAFGLPPGKQAEGWTLVTIPKNGRGTVQSYVHYIPH